MENSPKQERNLSLVDKERENVHQIIDKYNLADRLFITKRYGPMSDGSRFMVIDIHIEKGMNIRGTAELLQPQMDYENQNIDDSEKSDFWKDEEG